MLREEGFIGFRGSDVLSFSATGLPVHLFPCSTFTCSTILRSSPARRGEPRRRVGATGASPNRWESSSHRFSMS